MIRTFRIYPVYLMILLSLLVSACGPGQILGPTLTPTPTLTPSPTNTPIFPIFHSQPLQANNFILPS